LDTKEKQFIVMTKTEVDGIRGRSKSGQRGPWVTDYEEMGKKTVIRKLCKYLPLSIELDTAVELDNRAAVDIPQDLSIIASDEEMGTVEEKRMPMAWRELRRLIPAHRRLMSEQLNQRICFMDKEEAGYISGLVDGEGYFSLSIKTDSRSKRGGIVVHCEFGIGLRMDDYKILEWIKKKLNCGTVRYQRKYHEARYYVRKRNELKNNIIPFFNKYKLRAKKKKEFKIWCKGINLAYSLYHKKREHIKSGKGFSNVIWKPKWESKYLCQFQSYVKELKKARIYHER
jgi:hypothetical protein